jgi:hypothetical protein
MAKKSQDFLLFPPALNPWKALKPLKLHIVSLIQLCQQTQTLNLLVVVEGQCTMGCAADESGMERGFSAP